MFRSSDHHQGTVFLCLAKVTLKDTLKPVINYFVVVVVGFCGSMPCCVMLCCEDCPAMDVRIT